MKKTNPIIITIIAIIAFGLWSATPLIIAIIIYTTIGYITYLVIRLLRAKIKEIEEHEKYATYKGILDEIDKIEESLNDRIKRETPTDKITWIWDKPKKP